MEVGYHSCSPDDGRMNSPGLLMRRRISSSPTANAGAAVLWKAAQFSKVVDILVGNGLFSTREGGEENHEDAIETNPTQTVPRPAYGKAS